MDIEVMMINHTFLPPFNKPDIVVFHSPYGIKKLTYFGDAKKRKNTISEKISVALDILTSGSLTAQQFRRLDGLISQLEWYDRLSEEKKAQACELMFALIQLIQEEA